MGLEIGTFISDLVATNPLSTDQKSVGDDHIRLLKTVNKNTFPNADRAEYFARAVTKTANYTILSTDLNKFLIGDATAGNITQTLPALGASNDGWSIDIIKGDSSVNTVTIAGTINGVVNLVLSYQYEMTTIRWSGTAWYADSATPAMTDAAALDLMELFDASARLKKRITLTDMLAVVNFLTADAVPDQSADYLLTYDASAAAAKKVLLSNFPSALPRGYHSGGILSNGTDSANDINLTAGKWRDSTDTVDIVISANTAGKQLDSPWVAAATTNTGMRNSVQNGGSVGNFTYQIYAARTATSSAATIYAYAASGGSDHDSAAVIAIVLAALQAETGGASYVYARRIGSVLREGGSNVLFVQDRNYFRRKATALDVSLVPPNTNAITRVLSTPIGIRTKAHILIGGQETGGSNGFNVLVSDLSATDEAASASNTQTPVFQNNAGSVQASMTPDYIWTDFSAQVRSRISVADADNSLRIRTVGWWDPLGEDAA